MRALAAATLVAVLSPLGGARAATVDAAWSRATVDAASPAAVFATIHGDASPNRLLGVSTPAAREAMLHEMDMNGDTMRMRMVEALPIPAAETLTLGPAGAHVMLAGLARALRPGDSFPATFRFAHGAPVTVTVRVGGPGASGPP